MAADFVHLHLHTHYSMLDGACTAKGLVKMAKEMEMPGIAITDHGYMGGTEEFHRILSGEGLVPIIGMEAYVSPTTRFDKNPMTEFIKGFHLVLLAENICLRLYGSIEAAGFLRLYSLLVPMLYCDAITDAMTKGLGQQTACVRYNILTSTLDVIFLFLLLPRYGMMGYFVSFFAL